MNKVILYHGSSSRRKFKRFRLPNKNTKYRCPNSYHVKAIFLTDSDYVNNYNSGHTYTCEVNLIKLLKLHELADEQEYNSLEQEFLQLYPDLTFNYRDSKSSNTMIKFLKSKGYNGMLRTDGTSLTHMMFNPDDIKILEVR